MAFEMALHENYLQALAEKYVTDGVVLGVGTGAQSGKLVRLISFIAGEKNIGVKIVPTSLEIAGVAHSFDLGLANLNDEEVDVAFEFADRADKHFNYVKTDSLSLVRDKMIAQSAEQMIVICEKEKFTENLSGMIPFEIASFAAQRTVNQLSVYGEARLRMAGDRPYKTETGQYIAEVQVDKVYSLEELETKSKEIPGVLETGLFLGYADMLVLHNHTVDIRHRLGKEIKLRKKKT